MSKTTSARAFGHHGVGGQLAWADPDSGLSFSFLTDGHDRNLLAEGPRRAAINNRAGAVEARSEPLRPRPRRPPTGPLASGTRSRTRGARAGELQPGRPVGAGGRRRPDHEAFASEQRRLTYAELDARANRLAHHLAAQDVGPGDFVGLHLLNGSEYLEGMLATYKLRAVPVNVNYRYVEDELEYLYRDAGLVALIHHRQFAPSVTAVAPHRVPAPHHDLGRRRSRRRAPGSVDYDGALTAADDAGTSDLARPTTSTSRTRGARPACPRACSGGTRTSSSGP